MLHRQKYKGMKTTTREDAMTMKRVISAACFAALAPLAQADTVFGVYAGVGQWNADFGGDAGTVSIDLEELNIEDETNNFFYIALEHPIPLLPNIKLQNTEITSEETATLTRTFTLDDQQFTVGEEVTTDVDLTHTDATLYYELLDNWINLDLGLTLRAFDGEATVISSTTSQSETVDLDEVIPLVYAKAQFDLPFTGWSIAADANAIGYSGDSFSDITAKIAYTSDALPLLDLGVELGFRRMALEVDDDDGDLNADLTIDGPYAAITLHF